MAGSRHKARCASLQALYQWAFTHAPIAEIETQFRKDRPMKGVDLAYFHTLLQGVSMHAATLDAAMPPLLDRPMDQLSPVEHAVLRLALYELLHQPKVPYKVVINEALELTKKYGSVDGSKYINAVLDRFVQERA